MALSEIEKEKIEKAMDKIQGWTSYREGFFLYEMAKKSAGKGVIVEIGSWKGKSTVCLGLGALAGKKTEIYAVDPHTGSPDHLAQHPGEKIWTFKEFKENMKNAGLENAVSPVIKTSDEAVKNWEKPIELLYLDVNYHDYELSKKDFTEWSKFVTEGGTIAIHNTYPDIQAIIFENQPLYGWPAPRKVLREFVFGSKNFKNISIISNTTYFTKCAKNNFSDKLKGRLAEIKGLFLILALKFYMILVRLPKPLKKFAKRRLFGSKN